MRVKLQGAGLWEAVDANDGTERQERQALGAILTSVPPEMVPVLAAKDNAKMAWDMIKTLRVGVDRVREARRQKLRKEFDGLAFRTGENTEDFSLRVSSVITELQSLGDTTSELDGVQKILRVAPTRYAQMACSIETLIDLKQLSIEELSGRLSASEGSGPLEQEAGGRLLLTEEEWAARQQQHSSGSFSGEKKGRPQGKPKSPSGGDGGKAPQEGGGSSEHRKGNCNYCGKPGHWAKECRKAQRDRERKKHETANLIQHEDGHEGGLLMAVINEIVTPQAVFLNEEKVIPVRSPDGVWFFDTGRAAT
jgi:hypothetical protein